MSEPNSVGIFMSIFVPALAICLAIHANLRMQHSFKERRRRRAEARTQDHLRVAEARMALFGGRRSGRTFAGATAAAAAAQSLSHEDLLDAWRALRDGPLAPQQNQAVAQEQLRREVEALEIHKRFMEEEEKRAKELKQLKAEIAEPFWAWHERKEQNETRRVGTDDIASSSAGSGVRVRDTSLRMVPGELVSLFRGSGVASQRTDRQDALAMGMDLAQVEASGNLIGNGLGNGGLGLPFHLGNSQGGER